MADLVIAVTTVDSDLKVQVKTLKGELKAWEYKFNDEHGRKPQKEDILQDRAIAKKYKLYSKLKSRLAEEPGHVEIEASASTELLSPNLATLGRDKTEEGLAATAAVPPAETYKDLISPESKTLDQALNIPSKKAPDAKTATTTDAKSVVDSQSPPTINTPSPAALEQAADNDKVKGSEDSLDAPIVAPEILRNPVISFRSTHPLLKHLSTNDAALLRPEPEVKPVIVVEQPAPQPVPEPKQETEPTPAPQQSTLLSALKTNTPLSAIDIFARIPKGEVLRCQVVRKSEGVDRAFPTYLLINETGEKFMLAARKRKKTKYVHYLISTNADDMSKHSSGYVGKVKADSTGTVFTAYDARTSTSTESDKGMSEILGIHYVRGTTPREIKVATRREDAADPSNVSTTKDIIADLMANKPNVQLLKNKLPTFNERTQAYAMNFGGRVKLPSVKNFQLCLDSDPHSLIFQFGRVTEDSFALDAFYPLTPIEAFSIALTAFDAFGHV